MSEIRKIPSGVFRLRDDGVEFVHFQEVPGWCLLGTDDVLVPGARVTVRGRRGELSEVEVGEIIAERVVRRRPDSRYGTGTKRYVVARVN